ncbi:HET-domain-containing protein [Apiospora marii]|uniref:HET-domain-containing protein n=1 Tax=Apiospora marii TaxID=335849 RepID=A0ABR1R984_9PEZI
MADPQLLIQQLELLIQTPDTYGTEEERHEIKRLGRLASNALEAPFETMQRLVYSPLPLVAARIGQDRDLFSTLTRSQGPTDLATLSCASGLEPRILESIMDYLCTQGMAVETEMQRYLPTQLSHLLRVPIFDDAVTHFHDNCLPGFAAFHRSLAEPRDGSGCSLTAFKLGQHTDEGFYTWLETHPANQAAFHRFMEAQFASLPTWLDVLNFKAELGCGDAGPADVMFVDVGGGNGSQCAGLRKAWPDMPGKMILQDKPQVLEKALDVEGMEKMGHDFLTEQAVKGTHLVADPLEGSRAYYFRQIMHNYDDDTCITILKAHLGAMGKHSVILIDDKVLPGEKPPADSPGVEYTAALSLAMKVMFDSMERRESHWRDLLQRAGLFVHDIRKFTKFDDAVIVARKHPEGHSICARCRSVPWAKLARTGEPGLVVTAVNESREQLHRSSCSLCRLLSTIKPQTVEQGTTELRLFSTRDALALHSPLKHGIDGYVDGRCLSFSESQDMCAWTDGFLALSDPANPPDYDFRLLNSEQVDIEFIQQCLAHCWKAHGPQCNAPVGPVPSKLRVIDCQPQDPKVVDAPSGCQYVALSYVWGSPPVSTEGDQSTKGFPRVVLDAIMVTTMLGMRYLWVDRHCIDQEDEIEKQFQIQQMGEIYSHADVVLVDASGSNANCGLPGLGSVNRPVRSHLHEQGVVFREAAQHVSRFVKESVWASRGWTLQESFLSRRRVFFTESEVSFLCNHTHCAESWKVPLHLTEMSSTEPFIAFVSKLRFSTGIFGGKQRATMLNAILEQYTARNLTSQSDALNACTGVLKRLETRTESFIFGVLTSNYHKKMPSMCLAWYHKNPVRRQYEFPSWTFLGWNGPATMGLPSSMADFMVTDDSKPSKWLRNEERVGFDMPTPSIQEGFLDNRTHPPRALPISGCMLNIRLRSIDSYEMNPSPPLDLPQTTGVLNKPWPKGIYAELDIAPGIKELRYAYVDSVDTELGEYAGLQLHVSENPYSYVCPILILKTHNGHQGEFERVGIVNYDRSRCFWMKDEGTYPNLSSEQIEYTAKTVTGGFRYFRNIIGSRESITII